MNEWMNEYNKFSWQKNGKKPGISSIMILSSLPFRWEIPSKIPDWVILEAQMSFHVYVSIVIELHYTDKIHLMGRGRTKQSPFPLPGASALPKYYQGHTAYPCKKIFDGLGKLAYHGIRKLYNVATNIFISLSAIIRNVITNSIP